MLVELHSNNNDHVQYDVYLARGKRYDNLPGNKFYKMLVRKCNVQYCNTSSSRKTKQTVSHTIIDMIHQKGGRFLHCSKCIQKKKGSMAKCDHNWVEVTSEKKILMKVGQALRDHNKLLKKTLNKESIRSKAMKTLRDQLTRNKVLVNSDEDNEDDHMPDEEEMSTAATATKTTTTTTTSDSASTPPMPHLFLSAFLDNNKNDEYSSSSFISSTPPSTTQHHEHQQLTIMTNNNVYNHSVTKETLPPPYHENKKVPTSTVTSTTNNNAAHAATTGGNFNKEELHKAYDTDGMISSYPSLKGSSSFLARQVDEHQEEESNNNNQNHELVLYCTHDSQQHHNINKDAGTTKLQGGNEHTTSHTITWSNDDDHYNEETMSTSCFSCFSNFSDAILQELGDLDSCSL